MTMMMSSSSSLLSSIIVTVTATMQSMLLIMTVSSLIIISSSGNGGGGGSGGGGGGVLAYEIEFGDNEAAPEGGVFAEKTIDTGIFPQSFYRMGHVGDTYYHFAAPTFTDINGDGVLDFFSQNHHLSEWNPADDWDLGVAEFDSKEEERNNGTSSGGLTGLRYTPVNEEVLVYVEEREKRANDPENRDWLTLGALDLHGHAYIDIDRDGMRDLYLTQGKQLGRKQGPERDAVTMWGEEGDTGFVGLNKLRGGRPTSIISNMEDRDGRGRHMYFFDPDNDGLLDYMTFHDIRNDFPTPELVPGMLHINQGQRMFKPHEQLREFAQTGLYTDADGDGVIAEFIIPRWKCLHETTREKEDPRSWANPPLRGDYNYTSEHRAFCSQRPRGSVGVYRWNKERAEMELISPTLYDPDETESVEVLASTIISGDFDGDTISDVIIHYRDNMQIFYSTMREPGDLLGVGKPHERIEWFMDVNGDRNDDDNCYSEIFRIADFDNDGKQDILHVCDNTGRHRFYSQREFGKVGGWYRRNVDFGDIDSTELPQPWSWSCDTAIVGSLNEDMHTLCGQLEAGTVEANIKGLAVLDYDNDGWMDVSLAHRAGKVLIYKNMWQSVPGMKNNTFFALKVEGVRSNVYGIGTKIRLVVEGAGPNCDETHVLLREINTASHDVDRGGSKDDRLHFGLGQCGSPIRMELTWPVGTFQIIDDQVLLQTHVGVMNNFPTDSQEERLMTVVEPASSAAYKDRWPDKARYLREDIRPDGVYGNGIPDRPPIDVVEDNSTDEPLSPTPGENSDSSPSFAPGSYFVEVSSSLLFGEKTSKEGHIGSPWNHFAPPMMVDYDGDGLKDFLTTNHFSIEGAPDRGPAYRWDAAIANKKAFAYFDDPPNKYYFNVAKKIYEWTDATDEDGHLVEDKLDTHGGVVLDLDKDGLLDMAGAVGAAFGRGTGHEFSSFVMWGEPPADKSSSRFNKLVGGRDAALLAGIENHNQRGRGFYALDANGDGLLDLFQLNDQRFDSILAPGVLMMNDGQRHFSPHHEVSEFTQAAILTDVDRDGYATEFVVHRWKCRNEEDKSAATKEHCLSRPGGTTAIFKWDRSINRMKKMSPDLNVDSDLNVKYPAQAYGTASGDFDSDGFADHVVFYPFKIEIYYSSDLVVGALPFVGTPSETLSYGNGCYGNKLRVFDIENDGTEELYVQCTQSGQHTIFHRTEGVGALKGLWTKSAGVAVLGDLGLESAGDIPEETCTDPQRNLTKQVCDEREDGKLPEARGAVMTDFDSDGYSDMITSHHRGMVRFYRNVAGYYIDEKNDNNNDLSKVLPVKRNRFIAFELLGTKSNAHGIGATVLLTAKYMGENGNKTTTQLREVNCISHDTDPKGSRDKTIVFGLGRYGEPESVTVRWPSGIKQVYGNSELLKERIDTTSSSKLLPKKQRMIVLKEPMKRADKSFRPMP